MKNVSLFFLALTFFTSGTFGQVAVTSITVTIANSSGGVGPNNSLTFGVDYYNNSIEDITMRCKLELRQNDIAFYSLLTSDHVLNENTNGSETISFSFPDTCDFTSGDYDVHLVINYFRPVDSDVVTATTYYNGSSSSCFQVGIPVEGGEPVDCDKAVFGDPVTYENSGVCCSVPLINITATSTKPSFPQWCDYIVSTNIVFPNGYAPSYSIEWNNGITSSSFLHDCGTFDYTLTLTWQEGGDTCTYTSEALTVISPCFCPADPPREREGNGAPTINEKSDDASFNVYPNPSRGNFRVKFAENKEVIQLEIRDIAGKPLRSDRHSMSGQYQFNLPQLNAGVYYLLVWYSDKSQAVQKIIIQ